MSMIKLSEILFEKNKYEKETGEKMPNWQEKLKEYEASKDFFVHFSNVPRAALYIVNEFNTPIGFYAYPLDFDKMKDFAVGRPYAIVFKPNPSAKILNLKSYNQSQYISDLVKLYKKYKITYEEMKKWESEAQIQSPAGFIWNVTRNLSIEGIPSIVTEAYNTPEPNAEPSIKKIMTPAEQQNRDKVLNSYRPHQSDRGGGQTGKWTIILNKILGYDGIIDDCLKIIHSSEPCQAVFFNTKVIEIKDIVKITESITTKNEISAIAVDYSNKDMSGQDLTLKDLSKAILFKTNLSGANLHGANLKGANLKDANLTGANLTYVTLYKANLIGTNLSGVNFENARLDGVNLNGLNLKGLNFSGAELTGANLKDANLTGANLTDATLHKVNLIGTNLSGANLRGAILAKANISNTNLENANLQNANLAYTNLQDAKLQGALYNEETVFPDDFNPADKKMKLSNLPQLSQVFSSIKNLFKEE